MEFEGVASPIEEAVQGAANRLDGNQFAEKNEFEAKLKGMTGLFDHTQLAIIDEFEARLEDCHGADGDGGKPDALAVVALLN
eukprot:9391362-Alexandrium_andersonii.AAC.1